MGLILEGRMGGLKKAQGLRIPTKLGYKNFYLYGAVEHNTGDHFNLIMPYVNSLCMNLYLQELSKQFADHKIVLIMDQAGWHKSKELVVPENICILYLPPYSPELNPA